jgi:CAAX protease family protein
VNTNNRTNGAILLFLVLSLGLSGCYWLLMRFYPEGSLPGAVEMVLWAILRGFGPALAAIVASLYRSGTSGLRELIASVLRWRVPGWLWLLAFLGPLILVGLALTAAHLFRGLSLQLTGTFTPRLVIVFFAMLIADGPLGEEVGWRGFLLPALLRKWGPILASVVVGVVWYLWHVPLYAIDGKGAPILFLADCIALSLIFTWFFLKSGYSTLLIIFLHNCSNYAIYVSRMLFPQFKDSDFARYIYYSLILILAILSAVALSRKPVSQRAATA